MIQPFVKILPIVILGILFGNWFPGVPLWAVCAAFAVSAAAAWIWRTKETAGNICVGLALFFFSAGLTDINRTRDAMPKNERLVMTVQITGNPETKGRWQKADAAVGEFRVVGKPNALVGEFLTANKSDADGWREPDADGWRKSGEKVIIRLDTTHRIAVGERLVITGRAGELGNGDYAGYARLMRRRGYSATVWVGRADSVVTLPGVARGPLYFAARLQAAAAERFDRLNMETEAKNVARAMSVGARGAMSDRVNESYNLTGATHLLSVSGLHVGIVASLINMLLWLTPLFRRGHIVKNIVAIAAIWLYAMLTGLSPSVVRAAMMFTGVQFALASSREGDGMNILLATAAVMLFINPNYLYDVSFQLSFMAMLGIFLLYRPMFELVRTRFKLANALWAAFIVGLAASVATAPLVSFYFGRMPVVGLLINPLVVVTAHISVLFSILWIIAPIGFLNGFFSFAVGVSTGLQNRIVEVGAAKWWASAEVALTAWQTVAVYAILAAIWLAIKYGLSSERKIAVRL